MLKESLDLNALKAFLKYAYDQGFNNISLSGGEPLLYKDLEALLQFTKKLGYNNTMATNGMLLGSARNQALLQYLDLVAVSIDGPPGLHDYIRGQQGAFEKMQQGLQTLRELNKPFGLIHTVTPESWKELIWLGSFGFDAGAKLLQLHPLELFGRARQELAHWVNDDLHLHRTYILANYLSSKYQDRMVIQADLLHRDYLQSFPQVVNGFARTCNDKSRLAQVIDNIVVDETGTITPFAYGFDPRLSIGNVHHFDGTLFDHYLAKNKVKIETMMKRTLSHVFRNKDQDIINWNEVWVYNSRKPLKASA
ncbi:MoaA/NifB/PqqE/SkfB family radical SAM enzyme [Niabella hirudinis]